MSAPALPPLDFAVIGAYKAATTTVHLALRAHGGVFVPERKEPSYFAFHGSGADDVAANPIAAIAVTDAAEYCSLYDDAPASAVLGDVSPEYLKHPSCAARLAAAYPDLKLVAVLRDPAERAFSDYLMYRRDGREAAATFAEAIGLQDARLARGEATGQYLVTGRYGEQLSRYYERFDRSQILVIRHDDLARDRETALRSLAEFLGVDPRGYGVADEVANRSGVPSSAASRLLYAVRRRAAGLGRHLPAGLKRRIDRRLQATLDRPELPPQDRASLVDYYRADVEMTEQLTGLDLSAWRTA